MNWPRPMMPLTAPNAVHASPSPMNTPEPITNSIGCVTNAIHSKPAI